MLPGEVVMTVSNGERDASKLMNGTGCSWVLLGPYLVFDLHVPICSEVDNKNTERFQCCQ